MRKLVCAVLLAGCGSGGGDDSANAIDGPPEIDADVTCPRAPAPADRARKVVVSLPYDAAGDPASTYRVLDLSTSGALSDPDVTFEMGRSFMGEIAFTPDGQVGLVAQDDGTLGAFRFDEEGQPVVIEAAHRGLYYAAKVVIAPAGDVAYVLDTQWRENGGGIYRVAIGCEGELTDLGPSWVASKLPAGLHLRGDRALLAAVDVGEPTAGPDAYLLDWTADPPAPIAGADAFADDLQIVGSSAVSGDFFLIGDYQGISEDPPNRIAVVEIGDAALTTVQTIEPLLDPVALVPSPEGDVVLAVSGFGDAIFVLDRESGSPPFSLRGELVYDGASPQLPGGAALIERGDLAGLVVVAENQGVRRVRMEGGGVVTDLGLTALGDGFDAITGAIGVQP